MSLRTSTPQQEGVYQASKFLKFQVLCDREELEDLFGRMGEFWIYPLTGVGDGQEIAKERFLSEWEKWIEELKAGRVPSDAMLRSVLACAWTKDESLLWKQEVVGGRFIVKMGGPVVQVQAHWFTYSDIDGVFRPMTMGPEAVFWGFQLSYPQLYQDPKTMEFVEGEGSEMFQIIRQWVRDRTRPTPFLVGGKKVNAPIRIGKNCLEWIGNHPQLGKIGIHA